MERIVAKMKNDMGITQYSNETTNQFLGRLVYSAMAEWMRYLIFDETTDKWKCKSKIYILERGQKILLNIVNCIPDSEKWFIIENSKSTDFISNSVKLIRDRMLTVGELIEVDERGNVGLTEDQLIRINQSIVRILGLPNSMHREKAVGLTKICEIKSTCHEMLEKINVDDYMTWLYKNAKWSVCNKIDTFEFFDAFIKRAPYQSWVHFPHNRMKRYLGRISLFNGLHEYYLFKKENNVWVNCKLSSVLSDYKEERRILLGLRKENGNSMTASFSIKGKVVILNLFCRLPAKEEKYIHLYCWPLKTIDDKFNYVVPIEMWEIIKKMLENELGIVLREK